MGAEEGEEEEAHVLDNGDGEDEVLLDALRGHVVVEGDGRRQIELARHLRSLPSSLSRAHQEEEEEEEVEEVREERRRTVSVL